ncbi:hypothetical protein F5B20DRAFT_574831 [Whalleya microplaca]|nr:hypothetical protein F5B20DRAFT_574831 [Whalleya microplaca]
MYSNYRGDPSSLENQGVNVPEEMNCALHLSNLPPGCTISDLLGAIRDVGKVYQSNVRPPTKEYQTAAAKVVFWNREAVRKLMALSDEGKFTVGSYVPDIRMNDHPVTEQEPSPRSRVVQVSGPKEIVQQEYLEEVFHKNFDYDLENVLTLYQHAQETRLEFRFSSYRCQASNAYKFILRASRMQEIEGVKFSDGEQTHWRQVRAYWGVDPCA